MLIDVGHIRYMGIIKTQQSRPSDVSKSKYIIHLWATRERDGETVCRNCHPLSIEIVQYNARIKNATRCNFECFHLLLAPATFLITHPYYYFVLFVLLLLLQFSLFLFRFYFGAMHKYWNIVLYVARSARTACHKYFSSYGPSGFQHSHTHVHTLTHIDTWRGETATEAGAGKIIKNNSGHKIGGNRTRERPMQKSFFIGPV